MAELRRLQDFATYGLLPDLTLLLDVPVEVGLERTRRRTEWNRFEDTEELAFFEQVRTAYLTLAEAEPDRFSVIDGSGSVEEADAAIRDAVAPLTRAS
jgi:dTMP kinase